MWPFDFLEVNFVSWKVWFGESLHDVQGSPEALVAGKLLNPVAAATSRKYFYSFWGQLSKESVFCQLLEIFLHLL